MFSYCQYAFRTIEFLRTKFSQSNIFLDEDTAKYIILVTADIPHYIQLLASEIWQNMINNQNVITKNTVDEGAQNVLALKSDYYMELFDRRSQNQKQLLNALTVEGKNIFSTAYINKHQLSAISTLQRSVKELINDGIIEKKENEYFIADPFFKLFVAQNGLIKL